MLVHKHLCQPKGTTISIIYSWVPVRSMSGPATTPANTILSPIAPNLHVFKPHPLPDEHAPFSLIIFAMPNRSSDVAVAVVVVRHADASAAGCWCHVPMYTRGSG